MLHRSVKSVALVMLAALVSFVGFATPLHADYGPQMVTRKLAAHKTLSDSYVAFADSATNPAHARGAYIDSLVFFLPTRSTVTKPDTLLIDTSDWDWNVIGQSATVNGIAYVNFAITDPAASGVDSIYCTYQTSPDGTNFSNAGSTSLTTYNASEKFSRFPILSDQDALNSSSFFGQAFIRIIVMGDTGGKLGGIQASVTYPRLRGVNPITTN